MGDNNHIHHRLDDNVADIPLFHGNDTLDTVKARMFMDRIQQGIDSLNWTPVQAFSYFPNALRTDADDWIHSIMYTHPEYVQDWTVYRPLFCQKYEVASIPHTFIHKVVTLTLASCHNKLDKVS